MGNTKKAALYMSSEEICKEYREAKNKKRQITILADQNLCKRADIIKILIEAGEDMGCMKPKEDENKQEHQASTIPQAILDALYEKLDAIDQEITAKEREYKQIVAFLQNCGRQQLSGGL